MRRGCLIWVVSGLAGCVSDSPPPFDQARQGIIGGAPSTPADSPSTGAILAEVRDGSGVLGSLQCSGSLIAEDVVLTAGHCSVNLFGEVAPTEFHFTFTRDVSGYQGMNPTLPPRTVEIREMLAHPDFDIERFVPGAPLPMGLDNYSDVALAFLETPITDVTPAVLVEADDVVFITEGSTVSIAGYGTLAQGATSVGVMHHADSVINELGLHEMQIGNVAPTPQKCHGDSGGPSFLAVQDGLQPADRLIGITSRAYGMEDCAEGGVDMRVDAFLGWIVAEMVDACRRGVRTSCAGGGGAAPAGPFGSDLRRRWCGGHGRVVVAAGRRRAGRSCVCGLWGPPSGCAGFVARCDVDEWPERGRRVGVGRGPVDPTPREGMRVSGVGGWDGRWDDGLRAARCAAGASPALTVVYFFFFFFFFFLPALDSGWNGV